MKKMTILFKTIFLMTSMLLLAEGMKAQNNYFNWAGAWQFGTSESVEVDTSRQLAFMSSGGAVVILDMSNPAEPLFVNDAIRTMGLVMDIAYDYNTGNLLLATNEAGLEIWDVNDENNPAFISNTEVMYGGVETPVEQVKVYQDFAILECNWGYVHSVDISDPYNPVQVGFNGTMGNPAHDIYVSEDGYVHATGEQYYVRLKINADGSFNTAGNLYYYATTVFGNTSNLVYLNTGQLYIIDLNSGQSSYTDVDYHDILVRDGYAYMIGDESFMIYDVSDFQNTEFVSSIPISSYTDELVISGHYAYIATGYDGMRVVDFSDLENPVEVGHYAGTHVSWKSTVSGDYAYIANSGSGLSVIDISDPYNDGPVKVGGISSDGETRDVVLSGNTAITADWTGGVRFIDVSAPASPEEINKIEGLNAWRVEVHESFLFVDAATANQSDSLRVYDISDINSPQLVSEYELGNLIWELEYHNGHLYIADNDAGLVLLDVSDPYNPFQKTVVDLPDVSDVDLQGNTAWIASTDWEGGLVSLDISDPANPEINNIYNPSGWYHPFHVTVDGDFVYTGENFGEVKQFDVSNPADPQLLDEYVTSGSVVHMEAMNNFLYVSDGPDGLQMLESSIYTGVEDQDSFVQEGIRVYPNPAKEEVYLEFKLEERTGIQIDLFNALGQKIKAFTATGLNKGSNSISINLFDLAVERPGYVLYRISSNGINESGKILLAE